MSGEKRSGSDGDDDDETRKDQEIRNAFTHVRTADEWRKRREMDQLKTELNLAIDALKRVLPPVEGPLTHPETSTTGEDTGPPSNLNPEAVAGQLERIIGNNKDDLSGYDKSWLQAGADYLRYLAAGGGGDD